MGSTEPNLHQVSLSQRKQFHKPTPKGHGPKKSGKAVKYKTAVCTRQGIPFFWNLEWLFIRYILIDFFSVNPEILIVSGIFMDGIT